MAKRSTEQRLTERVQKDFNRDNVQISERAKQIQCYWNRSPDGKIWIPNSGGPLYSESAKEAAQWLAGHIEEFRSLLPKQIRDWPIVVGERDTRHYPATFYPSSQYTPKTA